MPTTVKATYRGELRRLSFKTFPTYEQLYEQLYRVFPISHNYYLSNLLFTPDSSKASVQIAVEVHNVDQYSAATAPYESQSWANPMLRFTIFDETPHKLPAGFVPYDSTVQAPQPQHHTPQSTSQTSCCAVSQGKIEMEELHMPSFTPPSSSFCLFKYCSTCAKIFQGPWFACENCSIVLCLGCNDKQAQSNSFCVTAMAPHAMKKEVCAACPAESTPQPTQFNGWVTAQQGYCPAYPFGLPATHQCPPQVPAPPVIHRGVVCDICDDVIEGIRHKCLDCPDYDLCTQCITSGGAERHNAFHEFLEIKEPGRVIVHTVYSGDGERETPVPVRQTSVAPQQVEQPAVHYATCNLCDSRIRGDRYVITREQHPHHPFVKLHNASDYIRRDAPAAPMHLVTCDGCRKPVYGIRYKCMHPDCPDFDLCENCEAFPISMHPDNHPLLKMRSPDTVVPTVYRVGQTTLIHQPRSPSFPKPPSRVPSPSFERGYMANPNVRSNTMPATSSRSSSPVTAYHQPPYVARPSSQTMPGGLYGPGGLYDEPAFARQPQPWNAYRNELFAPPQPTVSRFSHSPSPSPPLVHDRTHDDLSRSPSPAPPLRQATWAPVREYPRWDDDQAERLARERREAMAHLVQSTRDLENRLDAQEVLWGAAAVPPVSVPAVPEPSFPSFWPKSSDELRHLMHQEQELGTPVIDAFSRLTVQEEPAVMDSPLTGEALLNPPIEADKATSLAALLNGYESESEVPPPPAPRASFVNDLTLPDGQIFPPGAEFMKCWQMVNSGEVDWPAETRLVYVGAQVELWTPELKAPEATGRYVSYWRLRDGKGVLFGDSIWIDINVAETQSNGSSLSSSRGQSISASAAATEAVVTAAEIEEDSDDDSSDASSVSLISMPSEDDEEWASVAPAEEPQGQRYVVLYDDASSESSNER
ncbi:hypothetical protein FB45DRAFT_917981 [Roridomyces roridus]|uniref:ZZ-type domain-containing protein n=1 Tax=Roridomyces roridus TaxID=1738132 RepID=A0AAD7BV33_9AGAR|nr:hypothetical protein FB45DRAFT_917981 [Roridomyces roridus]